MYSAQKFSFSNISEFALRNRTLFCLVFMSIIGLFWFPPNNWSDTIYLSPGDDWLTYELMSQRILNGDFFLMHVPNHAFVEHGFLYPHFIAFVHLLFGPGINPVYFTQFMLSSIIILCWLNILVSSGNRTLLLLIPLVFALFFLSIDLYLHYTERLLSENISTIPIVILAFAITTKRSYFVQGILCGFIYLFRLQLIPVGFVLFLYHAWSLRKEVRRQAKMALSFLLPYLALVSMYVTRYYLIYGKLRFFFAPTDEQVNILWTKNIGAEVYARIVQNFFVSPFEYHKTFAVWRQGYYWYVLHFVFAAMLFVHWKKHKWQSKQINTLLVLLFAVTFPYFFLATGSYGFRYSLPMIFVELSIILHLSTFYIQKASSSIH